jgi:hypothetical protein
MSVRHRRQSSSKTSHPELSVSACVWKGFFLPVLSLHIRRPIRVSNRTLIWVFVSFRFSSSVWQNMWTYKFCWPCLGWNIPPLVSGLHGVLSIIRQSALVTAMASFIQEREKKMGQILNNQMLATYWKTHNYI